jgi:hypothetical protein
MKPKARPKGKPAAKPAAKPIRKAPGLAAAKTLRTLFESAAVRQKAHDAGQELQKRLRDHNAAIQQRMETHRLRDMARGDTPLTARVGRSMFDPPTRDTTTAREGRAMFGPPRMTGGFDTGTRPRSRTPTRIIRRPRTPPRPIPRAPAPGQMPGDRPTAPPAARRGPRYRAFFEPP